MEDNVECVVLLSQGTKLGCSLFVRRARVGLHMRTRIMKLRPVYFPAHAAPALNVASGEVAALCSGLF
jgi:hypothetical protein